MDNILYSNHGYRHKTASRERQKKYQSNLKIEKGVPLHIIILSAAIVILVLYLAFFFYYHLSLKPTLMVGNVEIQFQERLDLDQKAILAACGLDRPVRYLDVKENQVAEAILKSFPYVKSVSVKKIFPTTVALKICGRKPICVSLFDTGTVSVPFAVDTEGRIFELGTAVKEFDLPVLSGMVLPTVELDATVPPSYVAVLEDLSLLQENRPYLYNRISEIAVDETGGKGYDLYVYFRMYDLPVRMGSRLDGSEMEVAVQVLDLLQTSGVVQAYRLLDFRSGKPILKKQR